VNFDAKIQHPLHMDAIESALEMLNTSLCGIKHRKHGAELHVGGFYGANGRDEVRGHYLVVGRAKGTPAMIWQHTEQEKLRF